MDILGEAARWFANYIDEFQTDNPIIRQNFALKEVHTDKVVAEALALARALHWSEEEVCLAGLIARFHDLARFPQFYQYQTFKDQDSRDHGDWAVTLFEALNPLPQLVGEARRILLSAIRYHNKKFIPQHLTERERRHCWLIRDADKIDIYRVVTQSDVSFAGVGQGASPQVSPYRPQLVENLLNGVLSDSKNLHSREELILLQLGWIYDFNYTASLRVVEQRGYLDQLIAELPAGPVQRQIQTHIHQTVARKLAQHDVCLSS